MKTVTTRKSNSQRRCSVPYPNAATKQELFETTFLDLWPVLIIVFIDITTISQNTIYLIALARYFL